MKKFSLILTVLFLATFCLQAEEIPTANASKIILQSLTGKYSVEDTVVTISLNGENALTATLADGTSYELILSKESTFSIKGMDGTVEFRKTGSGHYNEMVASIPKGTYTATRIADEPVPPLKSLTGRYAVENTVVTISANGNDTLTATMPDGTSYDLVSLTGTKFSIKGLNGTAEFKRGQDGVFTQVVSVLPDGNYTATRVP